MSKKQTKANKRPSPNGITINQQIASGVTFVKMYSKRAVAQDTNNPVLAAMSVALARSVMESTKKPMTEEMGQIIGVSMLAAFMYGQEAGSRIERSQLAIIACPHCQAVSEGKKLGRAKQHPDIAGYWIHHKNGDDYNSEDCQAGWIWERGISDERKRTD